MLSYNYLCQVVIVLLCVELHIASGDTFYIVTSSTSPCPGEFTGVPCLTLQEYVSNSSQSTNITFIVEPGPHNLSEALPVSNGYNFTMSSTNATVTCTTTNARFTFDTVENVHISGMTFQGCHSAIRLTNVTNANLTDNRFASNQQTANSIVHIYGAALYLSLSSVIINKCEFQDNRAYYGGAIHAAKFSDLTVYDSRFYHNTATGNGGAISTEYNVAEVIIERSLFLDNIARVSGGAIFTDRSEYTTSTIDQSEFCNNRAYKDGGALYIYSRHYKPTPALFTINSTLFNNNSAVPPTDSDADNYGGAIYIYSNQGNIYGSNTLSVMTNNCTFNNNMADDNGGAMYTYTNDYYRTGMFVQLYLTHNSFQNNTANVHYGGALSVVASNVSINATSSFFINNTANTFGGAIYQEGSNSTINVTDSSFVTNNALTEGGGAVYTKGLRTNISLLSTIFDSNSASYCGAFDVDSHVHIVILTDSVFTYNRATGQTTGGGVACINNASTSITNGTFIRNSANNHAGVFYIYRSVTTVDRSLFIDNAAAQDGGVFYTYLYASDYIIRRSQFRKNTAGDDGGVIFIGYFDSSISVGESLFDANSAVDRGGVIAITSSSLYMEINHTNIYNNTAQYGGVISACNSQITFLEDSFNATTDPELSSCELYEGEIREYNNTFPPDPVIPTQAPFTTESTEKITTESVTTEKPTTESPIPTEDKNNVPLILIVLSAVSSSLSLIAITTVLALIIFLWCRRRAQRHQYIPLRTSQQESETSDQPAPLLSYSSPIYNPNNADDLEEEND